MAYSFKDSLVLHNSLKWLDNTGTSRSNVITLDSGNNINLGTSFGDIYLNSNTTRSNFTFLNVSSGGVLVPQRLGIGFSSTDFSCSLAIGHDRYIGLDTNSGFLGLVGGSGYTSGGQIQLYNNSTGGHVYLKSGGEIALFSRDSKNVTLQTDGSIIFTPDGSTVAFAVSAKQMSVNTKVTITDTTVSLNGSTGALVVLGGMGVTGDLSVTGALQVSSSTGNISFDNTVSSSSATTGTIRVSGGIGIACSADASSITSGGGLTCSGGIAVARKAYFGGAVTIMDTTDSLNSITGSFVTYGGMGVNGTVCARSSVAPQIRITNSGNGNKSTLGFYDTSNLTNAPLEIGYMGSGAFGIAFSTTSNVTFSTDGSTVFTGNLVMPRGNSESRPQGAQTGSIRFNTTTNQFEGYTNATWGSISGSGSASDIFGTTYFAPELSPGSGDGNLRFVTKSQERMRINSAGNVGIGTSSPGCTLDVTGTCNFLLGFTSGSSYVEGTLDVLNDSTFYGAITNASDIRLKKNIVELDDKCILNKIETIRPIKFNYKYANSPTPHIGFIAQDFIPDFPELTRLVDGYYTLDYSKVTVVLLMCVKELVKQVRQLQNELQRK